MIDNNTKEILHDIAIDLRVSLYKRDWTDVPTSITRLYDIIRSEPVNADICDPRLSNVAP